MASDRATGGLNGEEIEFDGESAIGAFVDRVVALVHGSTESFPEIDALIAGRRARCPVRVDPEGAAHPEAEGPSMAALVLVLAAGRHDEAGAMLAEVAGG